MATRTKTTKAAAPAKRAKTTTKAAPVKAAPAKRTRAAKAPAAEIIPIKRGPGRPRKERPEVDESERRGRGRPAMNPEDKKRAVPLRLPPDIHDWFMENETSEGWRKDMENLLIKHARRKAKAAA